MAIASNNWCINDLVTRYRFSGPWRLVGRQRRFGARHLDHDDGPATARRAVINYGHPYDRPPTVADKIIDIFAITKSGQQSLIKGLTTNKDGQWFVVETAPFRDDGHTLLAVRYDNGYWIETADGYRNATNRAVPT